MTATHAIALIAAQCEAAGMYERALFYFVASALATAGPGEAMLRVAVCWAGVADA